MVIGEDNMLYCLVCIDKDDSLQKRIMNRTEHLSYVAETNVVKYAGPFLSEDDVMIGSLIVIDVEDLSAAEDWAENDPYNKAELFRRKEIFKFNHLI